MPEEKSRLFRVRINNQGYDDSGTYWGIGQPLFCVESDDFQDHVRADDREHAKQKLLKKYPNLKFKK